ncbi:MAG TPA: hypothetical protein VK425_02400 [Acidimicrobiales bacterium]|nr:hypothetical protein [Acidimicrobiales bacterium]
MALTWQCCSSWAASATASPVLSCWFDPALLSGTTRLNFVQNLRYAKELGMGWCTYDAPKARISVYLEYPYSLKEYKGLEKGAQTSGQTGEYPFKLVSSLPSKDLAFISIDPHVNTDGYAYLSGVFLHMYVSGGLQLSTGGYEALLTVVVQHVTT